MNTSSYKMVNKLCQYHYLLCMFVEWRATQVYGWVCLKGLMAGPPVALLQVSNITD